MAQETKYVVKKGDKYLRDGKNYHSPPKEVDNIADARFFKSIRGAMNSRYYPRKISEEYEKWSENYKKTGIPTPRYAPPLYHPTDLRDGYSIVPITIKATIQVEETTK